MPDARHYPPAAPAARPARRFRQERGLTTAQQQARHMRGNQPHKANTAHAGDAGRRQHYRGENPQQRQPGCAHAKARSSLIAEQRHVRGPGGKQQQRKRGIAQSAASPTSVQFAACRLPASHSIAVCTSRTSAVVIKTPIAAANAHDTPMPIKINRGREISRARAITSSAVSSPPVMPISGRRAGSAPGTEKSAAVPPRYSPPSRR